MPIKKTHLVTMIVITKVILFLLACIIASPIPSPKGKRVPEYVPPKKAVVVKGFFSQKLNEPGRAGVKGGVASLGRLEFRNGATITGPTLAALKTKDGMYDLSANVVSYKGKNVRAELGPSLKTGFSKSKGQVSASLLGVGFNYGRTTGIETPVGSFNVVRGRYQDDDDDDESFDDMKGFEEFDQDDEDFEDDDESFADEQDDEE